MDQKPDKSEEKAPESVDGAKSLLFTSQGSLVQVQYRPPNNFNDLGAPQRPPITGVAGATAPERLKLLPYLNRGEIAERFWSKVRRGDPRECWPWLGSKKKLKDQYGRFKIASYTTATASRCAYALATGEEPGEWSVLHHCDNPPCCNPAHLYLGTDKDNSNDKMARGRHRTGNRRGNLNGANKLGPREVYDVWRCIRHGMNNCQIAKRFGVHHSTISVIRVGRAWKHLTDRLAVLPQASQLIGGFHG